MEAVGCEVGDLAVVKNGIEGSEGGSAEKHFEQGGRRIVEVRVDRNGEEAGEKSC